MTDHRLCIAPMMAWTDRHERFFLRLITRHAHLYTEMITSSAILHGDRQRLLGFSDEEHPVALQLGGSVPADLAAAARIGEAFGYDEINLNVGCPSARVQGGNFGACLMADPELVARCVNAMGAATSLPVTVKCRIGIDDADPEQMLFEFVEKVAEAGCHTFIIHARKAWLKGLSTQQNRTVPELDYDLVYRLKAAHPGLTIVINGGITNLDAASDHLSEVDGVMLGRVAYERPYTLSEVDARLFEDGAPILTRHEIIDRFIPYVEEQLSTGVSLHAVTRHIFGLFHGMPGARAWRRTLSERGIKSGADCTVIEEALAHVSDGDSQESAVPSRAA